MKRIGILTFHRAINYGAVLQTYALQRKVADLGFDAEIVDYGQIGSSEKGGLPAKRNLLRKMLEYISSPVSRFWHLVRRFEVLVIKRAEDRLFRKDIEEQRRSFSDFEKRYLNISKELYQNSDDLKKADQTYDGLITGSDQVWNPLITQHDLAYFLNFVSDNNRKISYAASFGFGSIPEEFRASIAPELRSIKHLSVRESNGAELVREISGRDARVVVDPTLLLSADEWAEILPESRIKEPYIFCYALLGNPEISPLCKHLSSITGYRIRRLSLYPGTFQRTKEFFDRSITYVNASGPLEFLTYLKNASIVVTNSFHGTVFSLIFKKIFYVLLPKYSVERIVNMLELYGLSDRLREKGDRLPEKNDLEIDYSKVDPILVNERNGSSEFLENALSGL